MARTKSDGANLATVIEVMDITTGLEGKSFSITGHLGRPRQEIVALIGKAKGRFEERPNQLPWGRNSFLVTNADWTKNSIKGKVSSKFQEAKDRGISIISENELYELIIAAAPKEIEGGGIL